MINRTAKWIKSKVYAYARHMLGSHRAFWSAEQHETQRLKDAQRIHQLTGSGALQRLHIGAGFNVIANWINTDLYPLSDQCLVMDAGRPLPIDNEVLTHVFCEHLIEHLPRAQGVLMLQEIFRCLRPGGVLRIATPDLEHYLGLFEPSAKAGGQSAVDQEHRTTHFLTRYGDLLQDRPMTPNKALNHVVRNWGHQFIWSKAELMAELGSIGFASIRAAEIGQSTDPVLQGLERHQLTVDGQVNQLETMVLEVLKPSNRGETRQ